jgi:hypothetical protein
VHVLFWPDGSKDNDGPNSFQAATALRNRFIDEFHLKDVPECKGLSDDPGHICMFPIDLEPGFGIATPFLVPNFAVFVPNDDYAAAAMWFQQYRGNLDVLLHPNSGCAVEDHVQWAAWMGNKWELKMSF